MESLLTQIITGIIVGVVCFVIFVSIFMTRTSNLPYLTRRLTVELMFSHRLANQIQIICDSFRQGKPESTDIVIFQCAYQSFVDGSDVNQILDHFPGMIRNPVLFRVKCGDERVSFDELLDVMGVTR